MSQILMMPEGNVLKFTKKHSTYLSFLCGIFWFHEFFHLFYSASVHIDDEGFETLAAEIREVLAELAQVKFGT